MMDNDKITLFYANVGIDYWPQKYVDEDRFTKQYSESGFDKIYSLVEKKQKFNPLSKIDFLKQPPEINYPCHAKNKFYDRYLSQQMDNIKEQLVDVDLVVLSELCTRMVDSLNLKSYVAQNYGLPKIVAKRTEGDPKKHSKSLLVGSRRPDITVLPVWRDNYLKQQDRDKYFYDDPQIRENITKYAGSVEIVEIKTPGHPITIVNVHNRFLNKSQFSSFINDMIRDFSNTRNIIILGDFNSLQFRKGEPMDETILLNQFMDANIRPYSLENIYDTNKNCQKPQKTDHLRVYFRLKDYYLQKSLPISCEYNLFTSSHVFFKLVLTKKKKRYKLAGGY